MSETNNGSMNDSTVNDLTASDVPAGEVPASAVPSGGAAPSVEDLAAVFLKELRARLDEQTAGSLARRLGPAVATLTDGLVIVACDRLARGDLAGFFETMLEGLSPAERSAWRRELTADWFQAAQSRWQSTRQLRLEIVETILLVKALLLAQGPAAAADRTV